MNLVLVDGRHEDGQGAGLQGALVGVIGAAGGVGATSLAVAIACLGAERTSTALVDLDPLGVGVERVIGAEADAVTTWDTLGTRSLSPRAFREALPVYAGVRVVGFGGRVPRPVEAPAMASVLSACSQSFGLTVIDLPRASVSTAQGALARCDLVVVVCPQSLAAALSGQRVAAALAGAPNVALVTRAGPRSVDPIEIAEALGVPLLAEAGDQRGVDEALGAGLGPLRSRGSGLRALATAVLDHLMVRA